MIISNCSPMKLPITSCIQALPQQKSPQQSYPPALLPRKIRHRHACCHKQTTTQVRLVATNFSVLNDAVPVQPPPAGKLERRLVTIWEATLYCAWVLGN